MGERGKIGGEGVNERGGEGGEGVNERGGEGGERVNERGGEWEGGDKRVCLVIRGTVTG